MKTLLLLLFALTGSAFANPDQPNIIFVMVDDAGTGDFSNYGGKHIQTPVMERLARQGMQFDRAYAGSAVCAPTRCVLMTGLHPGHCHRRANRSKSHGLIPLPADTPTVASVLKKAGYKTGGFGKWGLGNPGTTGVPEKLGFDLWYGYYDQVHAHDYYPEYLIQNSEQIPLPENAGGKKGSYTHYLIEAQTIQFIEDSKDGPFFCYAASHYTMKIESVTCL
jgi:arylsulfatase A-like enzyme